MSTNSLIGRLNEDGSVTYIYCHWDGYLSHNGRILSANYTDSTKVDALLDLGNLSALGENIDQCFAYQRYLGEYEGNDPETVASVAAFAAIKTKYLYLYKDSTWHLVGHDSRLERIQQ